ncbi:MAG: carboxypeptidase regulatory-like domain-containing protein, partial [Acidobacteriota bacterium]
MKRVAFWILALLALAALPLWAAGGDDGRQQLKTEVVYPCTVVLSPPFKDLPVSTGPVAAGQEREIPNQPTPRGQAAGAPLAAPTGDGALQSSPGLLAMPGTVAEFAGISNLDGVAPPDTEGDIGPNHYVQWVNLHLAAWQINRSTTPYTATLVLGPVAGSSIWASLGGPCASNNDGDPIVLWDRFRNRWVISQFALPTPYYQAIAVSQTADPTGSWWLYCFQYDATNMNDYPKFGVWPDGYYMTVNQFANGSSWAGAGLCVFEADKMINGDSSARMLKVDLGAININYGSLLPAHFEGMTNPPANSPAYFVEVDDGTWIPGYPNDALRLWEGHVNWTAGTFTVGLAGEPNQILDTAPFDPLCIGNRNCIPQPGTTQRLDSLGDRLMYRLQYRNYGSYESMVVNHSVDVGSGRSGIRWYELRKTGSNPWSIYQQGTYAPSDSLNRWMGSAAQDHVGNLAVGYSVSDGTSMYPSVYYAGRLSGDPPGTLGQGEIPQYLGAASQTGVNRWGDYSTMSVDPVDDCTFWYTQEYSTGGWNWATRIGAFKYGSCSVGPTGTLTGHVTDAGTSAPLGGATVTADNGTITVSTLTQADGSYTLTLPVSPPAYTVTASKWGYVPASAAGVAITNGGTTVQDFQLNPAPSHVVSGYVTDATTGWPLYASLQVSGSGYPGTTLWTDPVTGFYSITLADGVAYTFTVNAYVSGYSTGTATVTPSGSDVTQDFPLNADTGACTAPGYHYDFVWFRDFEADNGGFTVSGTTSWAWGAPTSGPGAAHSGVNVWGTNLSGSYNNNEDGYITSPLIDLSAYAGQVPLVQWYQYLDSETNYDYASMEVSNNGGGSWTRVYGETSGHVELAWTKHLVVLDASYAVSNFRIRFRFRSDSSVTYPGYYIDDVGVAVAAIPPPPPPLWSENFDSVGAPALPAGWATAVVSGSGGVWATRTSTSHPSGGAPHSAPNLVFFNSWSVSSGGSARLYRTTGYDLTGVTNPRVTFWMFHDTGYSSSADRVQLQVSTDGGGTWQNVGSAVNRYDGTSGWKKHSIDLTGFTGPITDVRIGLLGISAYGNDCHVDDVAIESGAVPPPPTVPCVAPASGGLIVGNVYDGNTGLPLNGATVANTTTGGAAVTAGTPDPAVDEGFYCLYGDEPSSNLTATKTGYGPDGATVAVPHFGAVKQDFHLPTAHLAANPTSLEATLAPNATTTLTLTLTENGGAPADFQILERDGHVVAPVPFRGNVKASMMDLRKKAKQIEKAEQETSTGRAPAVVAPPKDGPAAAPVVPLPLPLNPGEQAYACNIYPGSNLQQFPDIDVPGTWTNIGNYGAYSFFAADFLGGDFSKLYAIDYDTNALYTIDTATAAVTLVGPCTPFGGESWTGLTGAVDGTLYAASTNLTRSTLYTVDPLTGAATVVGQITNAPGIIDIAINPAGEMYGVDIALDSLVRIDPATGAGTVVGPLGVNANYAQGLDFDDLSGTLYWAAYTTQGELRTIDTSTGASTLVGAFPGGAEVDGLAIAAFAALDVPWLSESPTSGTVGANSSQDIAVTFDSTGLTPGDYLATLQINNTTLYGRIMVPVTLHVTYAPVVVTASA